LLRSFNRGAGDDNDHRRVGPQRYRSKRRWCFRIIRWQVREDADVPHPLRLLPARRERPRDRRAAEQRNEVAPVQIASKPGGESEIMRRAAEKAQEAVARITSKAAAATTETESTTSSR